MLLKFPHHSQVEAADVADFAFPANVRLKRIDVTQSATGIHSILYGSKQFQRADNCHVFLLKTQHNIANPNEPEDLYGICVRAHEMASLPDTDGKMHDISCPIAYCILSRHPFFELHQAVIMQILMLLHLKRVKHLGQLSTESDHAAIMKLRGKPLGPHQVPACVQLLKKFYDMPLPQRGQSITLTASKLLQPIQFHRPAMGKSETHTLIAQWNCNLAWTHITPEMLLDLLELALREAKIIVVDKNLGMLSAAVYSLAPLLSPLKWSGVFLPILPSKLSEFLEAPVPIIAGVVELPAAMSGLMDGSVHAGEEETMAIWFPSQGRLQMPKVWKRLLPNRSQLLQALKPHFTELRRLAPVTPPSRTLPHQLRYETTVEELAHIKIMLHLIETELVNYIAYVRQTLMDLAIVDKKMNSFIQLFRETQMLSHYLQSHEYEEDDY